MPTTFAEAPTRFAPLDPDAELAKILAMPGGLDQTEHTARHAYTEVDPAWTAATVSLPGAVGPLAAPAIPDVPATLERSASGFFVSEGPRPRHLASLHREEPTPLELDLTHPNDRTGEHSGIGLVPTRRDDVRTHRSTRARHPESRAVRQLKRIGRTIGYLAGTASITAGYILIMDGIAMRGGHY
jgi:hypothetical protein